MKTLITRPEPDASIFAGSCRAAGLETVIAPLMEAVFPEAAVDLQGVGALAFTSANGVRAFAKASDWRDAPVFAVGAATALAARDCGFREAQAADGDVESLAALIARLWKQTGGDVLHIAGTHLAGDLAGLLAGAGVPARRQTLYEMRAASVLPDAARLALTGPSPADWAAFFSPRTGRLFVELVKAAGLEASLKGVAAVCLSGAVADALEALTWKDMRIAKSREAGAMIEAMTGRA